MEKMPTVKSLKKEIKTLNKKRLLFDLSHIKADLKKADAICAEIYQKEQQILRIKKEGKK